MVVLAAAAAVVTRPKIPHMRPLWWLLCSQCRPQAFVHEWWRRQMGPHAYIAATSHQRYQRGDIEDTAKGDDDALHVCGVS